MDHPPHRRLTETRTAVRCHGCGGSLSIPVPEGPITSTTCPHPSCGVANVIQVTVDDARVSTISSLSPERFAADVRPWPALPTLAFSLWIGAFGGIPALLVARGATTLVLPREAGVLGFVALCCVPALLLCLFAIGLWTTDVVHRRRVLALERALRRQSLRRAPTCIALVDPDSAPLVG